MNSQRSARRYPMTSNNDAIWVNRAKKAILLIRILVGWVFLSEGIQKFLFPEALGVGRFTKIGIPMPQLMAPFVGVTEIICGALLLVGLVTRLACVPLLIDICVALYSTKIVTFMKNGFWGTLHEARTDVSMLLALVFLLIVGGGTLALVFVGESFSVSDCSASVHFASVLTANRVVFNERGTAA